MSEVKNMKDHKLQYKRFGLFVWCDASNQNRIDGGSTQGYLIGASNLSMLQGSCEHVSPIAWNSSKIHTLLR